nr:hypothetical protein [Tanacetum cinerariifolium]
MNVTFDELLAMAFEQHSSKPGLQTTARTVPPAQEPQVRQTSMTSTTIVNTAPTPQVQIHPQVLLNHQLRKMWIHRTCIRFINHTLTNFNGLRINLWYK